MKSREEILSKARTLENFPKDSAYTEARHLLLDIAGDSETDLLPEDDIHDYLDFIAINPVKATAGALVVAFLFDS